ncbi:hypothetical protein AXF42_Ash001255 [Apostasia shenzhenica]|uniref:Ubiquitin-like domain-containing protein n=1 Tax=Apostasia shenzhenica TaxID=1088818 RepID=A0A2I0AUF8_9ASPA|nr:hypothetical protein AXF42_Ash001255 [Apostasia shenzhenica]
MGTSGAAKFPLLNDDVAANSETTVEIKIKTLDSQTYTLRVNKQVPVPDLKEKIATVTGVLSEQQRLICRGRVLKDDQLLSAYPSNSASGSMPPHRNQATRTVVVEAVNVDHGYIDSTVLSRVQQTSSRFPSAVSLGPQNITVIPDSLTTLRQYLDHMKNEFRTEMPGNSIFIFQHLARQLENHTGITDTLTRSSMQSSAIRSGFLLQNLGSLLLELGRTTMTLRLGQIPSEAVVNAGPAVFISASGPNPVMVQPVPFYPGSSFGGTHMGSTSPNLPEGGRGSAFLPRNIDIRIHTGSSSDSARTSATGNFIHQAASDHPGSATLAGESGVRVVPVRTVLVPARISNVQSEMSGNSVALLYPLLARVRHQNTGSPNDASDSQIDHEGQGSGFATELSSSNEAVGLDVASRSVNDQAVLFSNFLHQLMPLITQENAIVPNVPIAGPNPSSSSSSVVRSCLQAKQMIQVLALISSCHEDSV